MLLAACPNIAVPNARRLIGPAAYLCGTMTPPVAPLMLALECSTDVCSAALFAGPTLLAHHTYEAPRLHARLLPALVRQLLGNLGHPPAALAYVAVASGPGSYTGLRIAVSSAKGLCMATTARLVGVGSLEAQAAAAQPTALALGSRCIVPIFDARRMEVYAAAFAPDGRQLKAPEALVVEGAALLRWAPPGPTLWVGDAVAKCAAHIGLVPGAVALPHVLASAVGVGIAAWRRLEAHNLAPPDVLETFEPSYIKPVCITTPATGSGHSNLVR